MLSDRIGCFPLTSQVQGMVGGRQDKRRQIVNKQDDGVGRWMRKGSEEGRDGMEESVAV